MSDRPGAAPEYGVGVCTKCDADTVRPHEWGPQIEGEACLGCGGPLFGLLGTEIIDVS